MNIYTSILGVTLFSLATYVHADAPEKLVSSLYNRKSKETPAPKPREYQLRGEHGGFAYAEYLLWEAQQEGLPYAGNVRTVGSTGQSKSGGLTEAKIKTKNLHPEYTSGGRVGFGYLFSKEQDGWDVVSEWTGYHGKASGKAKSEGTTGNFLNPLWAQGSTSGPSNAGIVKTAAAHWHLNYQTINFELGRNTLIGKKLSIRPFVGAEWALLQQQFRVGYHVPEVPATTSNPTDTAAFTVKFRGNNDFIGAGLRLGADAKWYFSTHFGLQGKIAAALLWGRFHMSEKLRVPDIIQTNNSVVPPTVSVTSSFTARQRDRFHCLRPNLQAAGGLFWQTPLKEGRQAVLVALDYEFIGWFFQNNLSPIAAFQSSGISGRALAAFSSSKQNTLLGLQGISLSVQYDF